MLSWSCTRQTGGFSRLHPNKFNLKMVQTNVLRASTAAFSESLATFPSDHVFDSGIPLLSWLDPFAFHQSLGFPARRKKYRPMDDGRDLVLIVSDPSSGL